MRLWSAIGKRHVDIPPHIHLLPFRKFRCRKPFHPSPETEPPGKSRGLIGRNMPPSDEKKAFTFFFLSLANLSNFLLRLYFGFISDFVF